MSLSRSLFPILGLATLAVLLLAGPGPLAPFAPDTALAAPDADVPERDPVPLDIAERDLEALEDSVKRSRSTNPDIIASINAVAAAYGNLQAPPEPELEEIPEDATEEQREEIEDRNEDKMDDYEREMRKFDREAEKWQKSAKKALIKALKLEKIDRRTETNIRDDVVIAAARALASTGDPELAEDIQQVIERNIMKADHDVPMIVLEEVFGAMARLNNHEVLEWLAEEFSHSRNSPPEVVDQLVAAHKSMILYKDVPGDIRYEIVDEFQKTYSGVESLAEKGTNDTAVQAAEQFWGRIKNDAIRVVQYFALEPTDAEGRVLARMDEFQEWFRDNDNKRRAPWVDEDED